MSHILGHKAIAGTIAASGIYDRFDRLQQLQFWLDPETHRTVLRLAGEQ